MGLLWSSTASAALFELGNHPDGNSANPYYGLRLDELIDASAGHDIFTFDFEDPQSAMYADLSGSTLHIYGQAFGGWDTGGAYDGTLSGLAQIDFTYTNVASVPGDDDLYVPTAGNSGSITLDFGPNAGQPIALVDYAGNFGFTFRWGDENDDLGHRGFNGISGWGWLNHSGEPHVAASDWLFTATEVPEPSTYALMGSMLLVGMFARRRVARQAS